MATGEWTGSGKWQEVQEAALEIPSSLQQIESNDLTKIKALGRGQFGSVWLCRQIHPFLSFMLCCALCLSCCAVLHVLHAVQCCLFFTRCCDPCLACYTVCSMLCMLCCAAGRVALPVLHAMLQVVSFLM